MLDEWTEGGGSRVQSGDGGQTGGDVVHAWKGGVWRNGGGDEGRYSCGASFDHGFSDWIASASPGASLAFALVQAYVQEGMAFASAWGAVAWLGGQTCSEVSMQGVWDGRGCRVSDAALKQVLQGKGRQAHGGACPCCLSG